MYMWNHEPVLFCFVFNTDDVNFIPLQPLNTENDKISLECQYCKKNVALSPRPTKKRRLCARRRRLKKKREKNTAQEWTLYETDSSGSTFYETDDRGIKRKLCGRRLRKLKKKKKLALLDQNCSGRPTCNTMYNTLPCYAHAVSNLIKILGMNFFFWYSLPVTVHIYILQLKFATKLLFHQSLCYMYSVTVHGGYM